MNASTQRQLYCVTEAFEQLGGISRATGYRLINTGYLDTIKVGSRTFITPEAIADCIDRLKYEPLPAATG